MKIVKSIAAVLAGMIFIVVTHMLTDFILESLGIFTPPDQGFHATWMMITALTYRIAFEVGGGYLTAKLAPSRPMLHTNVLGVIGLVMSTAAAVATIPLGWSAPWYPIALAVTSFPAVWFGGWLVTRSKAHLAAN